MREITSFRYFLFLVLWATFWAFVPLIVISWFTGPLSWFGLLVSLVFVWYVSPKVNAWLVQNTAFRHVWVWARANEETP